MLAQQQAQPSDGTRLISELLHQVCIPNISTKSLRLYRYVRAPVPPDPNAHSVAFAGLDCQLPRIPFSSLEVNGTGDRGWELRCPVSRTELTLKEDSS